MNVHNLFNLKCGSIPTHDTIHRENMEMLLDDYELIINSREFYIMLLTTLLCMSMIFNIFICIKIKTSLDRKRQRKIR
jgi:hypothetical protein